MIIRPIASLALCAALVSPSAAQVRAAASAVSGSGVAVVPALRGLSAASAPAFGVSLSAPALSLGASPVSAPALSAFAAAAPSLSAVPSIVKAAAIGPGVSASRAGLTAPSGEGMPLPLALERERGEVFWSGAASKDALDGQTPVAVAAAKAPAAPTLKRPSFISRASAVAAVPASAAALGLPEWTSAAMPWIQGVGALAGAYALIRASNWAIGKLAARRGWDRNAVVLARFAASAVLWTAGAGTAFFTLGQPVLALMSGGAGALTLANALAPTVKDHAGNLFQFVHFLLSRPFTIGDKITVGEDTGVVHDLTLRYMVLKDEATGEFVLRTYAQMAAAAVTLYGTYQTKELRLKLRTPALPHGLLRALRDAASASLWRPILWAGVAAAALAFFPSLVAGAAGGGLAWLAAALPYAKAAVVAWLTSSIARSLRASIERLAGRYGWTRPATILVKLAAGSLTWLIGGSFALSAAGLSLTAIGATFLIPTVLVSFIINDHLSAVIQGALLLKLRPFSVGDKVSLGKHAGEVVDVTLQHVVLKLEGGRYILVPHAVAKESAIRTPREYGARSQK